MRPLTLTMTAFGPFRDRETIDFRMLEDRRLFVISGNTGAGKTTIFDAICFALYGTASGEDRSDPRMLRSHFADEDTHTAVKFDFAVGRRSYSVLRQMPHRKGGNKSETGGKAELYETTSGESVPAVDRFIVSDVNAKLESIIGLTKEQFSQIVMLPQGEFRKLLTSDTDNKEEILRRIFRTELYERLEGRFQKKHREMQDQLKDAKSTAAAYMKQAQESLPEREDGKLARTFKQEVYSAAQVIEALEDELFYYRELAVQVGERKDALAVQIEKQESQLREAASLNEKFEEHNRKRTRLELLYARKHEFIELEHRLMLAEKAAHLSPYHEQAERTSEAAAVKKSQLAARQNELEAAEREHAQAVERYRTEENREDERRNAERELNRLIELAPIVRTLGAQQQVIDKLLQEEKGCAAKLAASEASLIELRDAKQASGALIKEMELETAGLAEKLDKLRDIEQQGKQLKRLADAEKELARISQLENEFRQAYEKKKEEHDKLEASWIEGQATLLAVHLHDGKPCPVCGSESHPAKADTSADVASRELLQQTKEQLSAVERELLGARAQAAAAQATREDGFRELAEYGMHATKLEEQRAQLLQQWKSLKEETDALQTKANNLPELKLKAEQQELLLERQLASKELLQKEQQQRMIERTAGQSVFQKELDRIPEQLRSNERLAAKLAEQKAVAERLASAWKLAQEQLQRMTTRIAEQKAYTDQAHTQLLEAESNRLLAVQRQQEELVKAGFADIQQYREAALPASAGDLLKKELEAYRSGVALLEQQITELQAELTGKQRIDSAGLKDQLTLMKKQLEQAIAAAQTALRTGQEAERLAMSIGRANGLVKTLEAGLEELMDVYHMLKGDNALKISFERFILIEFLEHILYAANARLRKLSNGQFTLGRSDRLEIRGKQSGLGLDVYDAYTGQNRDVKTLSGGEKFNASLCLALGMTDVIQSHQGGVSIEMMFIDEGFGSLDEESLQKAIAALVDLQKAGRMIGVISHVQELKDAFPACLEVNKTKEGFSRTVISLK
ncbi:SMC family ATPase [Paenibacillus alkaliterrae]|uniref:AAA family ATPase n=1 Tax=Paenibacillus alkaliterrae TaxID=320909 RepID=UPI001F3844FE|nr:SMC family ATPase [Paenibacillus alkaliterrae]MCF2940346.1 SMC family ATPase [Paenibacillus alkaliterrae]